MDSPQEETSVDAGRELWLQARKQLSGAWAPVCA